MFEKKNLFLKIFGIVFLVCGLGGLSTVPIVEAIGICEIRCGQANAVSPNDCKYDYTMLGCFACNLACVVNISSGGGLISGNPVCTDATIPNACRVDGCPTDLNVGNGLACSIVDATVDATSCKYSYLKTGKWDASQSKCVGCNGKKENRVYNVNDNVLGDSLSDTAGNNSFETACDASVSSDCDDIVEGGTCTGGVCDSSGQCIVSDALFLNASADPSAIEINATSTVTFTVTKNGSPVEGATVENIAITGGGFVSATSCATNASGECAITYTAPAIAGLYGVNATSAAKLGETSSGPAGVVISVSSSAISPCGPEIGVLCNPVDNASVFYDVVVIAIRYLLSIIALITFIFIVISGIKYLNSFGNEEKMKSAKSGLTSAVFGLALVLMAFVILETLIKILSS